MSPCQRCTGPPDREYRRWRRERDCRCPGYTGYRRTNQNRTCTFLAEEEVVSVMGDFLVSEW